MQYKTFNLFASLYISLKRYEKYGLYHNDNYDRTRIFDKPNTDNKHITNF